jgi:hypothetical protein
MALLGMAMGSVSCSDDDVNEVAEQQEATYVTLTINTGGSVASRSLNPVDEEASDLENYINPEDVFIYFFPDDAKNPDWSKPITYSSWRNWGNNNCKLSKRVADSFYDLGKGVYELNYILTDAEVQILQTLKDSCRVMITANCNNTSFAFNYGMLTAATATFNYPDIFGTGATSYELSESTPIPMFGIKRIENMTLKKGKNFDLGQVKLVRSLAKVEVKAKENIKIKDVKLKNCCNIGCWFPVCMWEETDWDIDHDGNFINIPHEHSGTKTQLTEFQLTDIPFLSNEAGDDYILYVPEFRQIGNSYGAIDQSNNISSTETVTKKGTTSIKLTYVKKDGTETSTEIDFKEYDSNSAAITGTEFNIDRNHHYLYEVEYGNHLNLKYKVIPWNEEIAGDITFN